jgi:osmotically-inducible protein OsmY
MRKLPLVILALIAIIIAMLSYQKFIARKDITPMLNDTRLTASLKTALALNRHLKETRIEVSVNQGVATLSGAVGTEIEKQLAGEIAISIKDVHKVRNNIVVSKVLTFEEPKPERTLGEHLDDLTIEASINAAFMLNENVSARSIAIESKRGHVTLTGTVVSAAEAELAQKIAEDVEGVISVQLNMDVRGKTEQTGDKSLVEKVDDARVVAQVRAALMVNRNIDSTEIEVASDEGVVTLGGIVRSGAEKDLAHRITEDCWGVREVVNKLRIKRKQQG